MEEGREPLAKHLPVCMEGNGDFPALMEFPASSSQRCSPPVVKFSWRRKKIPGEQENIVQNKILPLSQQVTDMKRKKVPGNDTVTSSTRTLLPCQNYVRYSAMLAIFKSVVKSKV